MVKQINIDKIIFGITATAILLFAALYIMTYETTITSTTVMQWQSDSTWTVGW